MASPPVTPRVRHFHLRRELKEKVKGELFTYRGDLVLLDFDRAIVLAAELSRGEHEVSPGDLVGAGLLHEIGHALAAYADVLFPNAFEDLSRSLRDKFGLRYDTWLESLVERCAPNAVFREQMSPRAFLTATHDGATGKRLMLEEALLFAIARENTALAPLSSLFESADGAHADLEKAFVDELEKRTSGGVREDSDEARAGGGLVSWLRAPIREAPHSLELQLEALIVKWGRVLEQRGILKYALLIRGNLAEEARFFESRRAHGGDGRGHTYGLAEAGDEAARYARDREWMPSAVLIAKSTLVWLDQLARAYGREVRTLDDIPDSELSAIAKRGITALWLIGIWERSDASRRIKERSGNPEAAASAYALKHYQVDPALGGEEALARLRVRAEKAGLRLACDMVPNHTGIDSEWMATHPEWFLQAEHPPFADYRFNGPDLSADDRIEVRIEDGYWSRTDAAVVFQHIDKRSGQVRYVYHGNDGTSMPWNDTAQLDYLRADTREVVIRTIVDVCKKFPIVRFDAAMTLAKVHVRRLWYPELGKAGGIPSRAAYAMSDAEFQAAMPQEFWREVAERVEREAPGSLLLAEAFWMLESYFVRSLGMHRVYNSAFMNMLRSEENGAYRQLMKGAMAIDVNLLGRYVNFLNNPDEIPAAVGFGTGDKYFAACTLLATLPGLPMFGHGQFEGFREKYGMEYRRAYDEQPIDQGLFDRHYREIIPLLRDRSLFSGTEHFRLYDVVEPSGRVIEDVYAFSNRAGGRRVFVVVNNSPHFVRGEVKRSAPFRVGEGPTGSTAFTEDVASLNLTDHRVGATLHSPWVELPPYGARVYGDLTLLPIEPEGHPHGAHQEPPREALEDRSTWPYRWFDRERVAALFATSAPSAESLRADDPELELPFSPSFTLEDLSRRVVMARAGAEALRVRAQAGDDSLAQWICGGPDSGASPLLGLAAAWAIHPLSNTNEAAFTLAMSLVLDEEIVRAMQLVLNAAPLPSGEPFVSWIDSEEAGAFLGRHVANGVEWIRREPLVALVVALVAREAFEGRGQEALRKGRIVLDVAEKAGYAVTRLAPLLPGAVAASATS